MFQKAFGLWFLLAGMPCVHAQMYLPDLQGYVTRVGTPADFDVNKQRVTCVTKKGLSGTSTKGRVVTAKTCPSHVYGEHVLLYGASEADGLHVEAEESPDHIAGKKAEGIGVIDALLPGGLLRVDGRAVRVTSATKLDREDPLTSKSEPEAGEWLSYTGRFTTNGVVDVQAAALFRPGVSPAEQKVLDRKSYDPASVTEEDRQSGASKFFTGTDPKRLPPTHDQVLQERVHAIGERLIPAVQTQLPAGDPDKLRWQFEVVDEKWNDVRTLPTGTILVPAMLVRELTDDEVAAVLSEGIAAVLERQRFRTLNAGQITKVATAGVLFGVVGATMTVSSIEKHMEEQSGRVALVLMHDAGFDNTQAPIAWWKLSSPEQASFPVLSVPARSAYLFDVLASCWTAGSPLLSAPRDMLK